jgi:hypothetical protein
MSSGSDNFEQEKDPIDIATRISEIDLQDALAAHKAKAQKMVEPVATGRCWNCDKKFPKNSQLRFCPNEDGNGSECRDEYEWVKSRKKINK